MGTTICNPIFPTWKKKKDQPSNCILGPIFLPIYGILSIADYCTTYYGIYYLNRTELSPAVNWLIQNNYFAYAFPVITAIIVLVSNLMLHWLYSKGKINAYRTFFFCMVLPKVYVVINNLYILNKYGG